MLKSKIVVVDEDVSPYGDLGKYLPDVKIEKFTNADEAFVSISKEKPDLVILDLLLSNTDGFEFIEKVKKIHDNDISFVVCSNISHDKFVAKAINNGVSYFMMKPINCELVSKRIFDIFNQAEPQKIIPMQKVRALEEKISIIFMTVGIPAHIKGYKFLREAIKMSVENPNIINSITKELYPSIAKKFETSASKVERAIRHAIEVAWNRGKIENINNLFGVAVYSSNDKPTNGEFIALVADKMLMENQ